MSLLSWPTSSPLGEASKETDAAEAPCPPVVSSAKGGKIERPRHHFNTYTSITATKAAPFSNGTQADILLSGITTIDNPAARNLYFDVTSTNPMGVTNQEFINRAALNHQPGPGEHDPRNDVLTSSTRAEEFKHRK